MGTLTDRRVTWLRAAAPQTANRVARIRRARRNPPARSGYLIGSGGRAGTGLLAHALWSTDQLGYPEEYLLEQDRAMWSARWGLRQGGRSPSIGDREFRRAVHHAAMSPNGVVGIKVTTGTARDHTPSELRSFLQPDRRRDVPAVLIHVHRRDKVAAAFSQWRARETGTYVRFEDEGLQAASLRVPPARWVADQLDYLEFSDRFWSEMSQHFDEFVEIEYEDLAASLETHVARVAELVGIGPVDLGPGARLPVRIGDPELESLISSYREAQAGNGRSDRHL